MFYAAYEQNIVEKFIISQFHIIIEFIMDTMEFFLGVFQMFCCTIISELSRGRAFL